MRKLTRLELLLCILPAAMLALPLWIDGNLTANVSEIFRPAERGHRMTCQDNLRRLGLAFMQYTDDYEKFPLATGGGAGEPPYSVYGQGWVNVLEPYARDQAIYVCPSDVPDPSCWSGPSPGFNDYWYNGNLSGKSVKSVTNVSSTLLLGEGSNLDWYSSNTNAIYNVMNYHIAALPPSWLTNTGWPSWRHSGGANYLFIDGHVAWLRPHQINDGSGQPNTFHIN